MTYNYDDDLNDDV